MKNIFFSLLFICSLGAVAQIDRSTQPKPGPAPEINLSEPETFTLKNGLKVIVVENHKLPRVSYTLTLDNPPIAEGEKTGAAALSGALLGKGSANISKDDFNEEVDYMGARMNFGSQYASAGGLSQYAERILELLADAAIHPNFTQEEFEKEQEILKLLNPVINSNSVWKTQALKFLGDFYYSTNQFKKAKQYYSILIQDDNQDISKEEINRKINSIKNE